MTKYYPEVDANQNFVAVEKKVLSFWKRDDSFKKSIKGNNEFIFYDGPPFANGLPHYGHLLTGFIKDLFARYQAMQGKKVERRFGWDCHGLPAEMAAEKELSISGKIQIEKYGVDKFNAYCRESVLRYTQEWEAYVNRQARWVDFENDYKTMDFSYMESVLWAFKELYKKGLIYESHRVMPYSWACETPVSDFETRMDNSYRERVSKSVVVKFKLKQKPAAAPADFSSYSLLVWTTTPWTLPSNLAMAVGKEVEYVLVKHGDECLIIAKDLAHKYENEIGAEIVATVLGADLVGLSYEPLFPYYKDHPNAFVVLHGDFVTTEDGTGVVHMAPGFGEDDQVLCAANSIELVCPVDSAGKFTAPIDDYKNLQVFEANDPIIIRLKQENKWLKTEQYIHNYPHCWRTDTPLIYKAVPSWYVKVTSIKDKMIANNQKINWIPGHIKDGLFGKWLENARDWSISRNRYWGCPIPIWSSDDPAYPHMEVYGSIQELEDAFGVKIIDLHRPFIDTLTKPNPSDPTGKSVLRRVTDVLDCWFESGSMPYAQVHYPFENKEWFEQHSTADFIVEYLAQTRGWFYTLLVLSTALFDRPPFLNCICHGVLLGGDGEKLSKRLKNYPDPNEVFETIGADAMRWFMIATPVMRGQDLIIDQDARGMKEALRTAIKPVWNAYNFFSLYANADQIKAELNLSSKNIMDRYIISRCSLLVGTIKNALDAFDTVTACRAVENFFEILNNWYIRRNRERFWKTTIDQDKLAAYNTLYSVLHIVTRAAAPLMPMVLEEIYMNLTQSNKSVHLELYPQMDFQADLVLIELMEKVRDACTAALAIRNDVGIKVRQPLASVTFIGVSKHSFSEDMLQLVLDEINVKEWFNVDQSQVEKFANYKLQVKFPIVGKRIPEKIKDIIAAQKQGQWKLVGDKLEIAGEQLTLDEFDILLEVKPEYKGKVQSLASNDSLVMLDLELSEELKVEGIARDLVRAIQQARKDAGLNISDKIKVAISANDNEIAKAISIWDTYIKEQTLALEISENNQGVRSEIDIEGRKITLGIIKA